MLTVIDQWEGVLEGERKAALEAMLPAILATRRWFGGKARSIQSVRIVESVPLPSPSTSAVLLFLRVEFREGVPETYLMPLTAAFGEKAAQIQRDLPHAVIAPLEMKEQDQAGVLYDALWDSACASALLQAMGQGARVPGQAGTLIISPTTAYSDLVPAGDDLIPKVMKGEQSNTSVAYGDRVIFKLYRRLQAGLNPDLEIGRVLTAMNFQHSPRVGGAIEYVQPAGETLTLAILHAFVKNQGDAWTYTLEALDGFLLRANAHQGALDGPAVQSKSLLELAKEETSVSARELIGSYFEAAKLLGQRTAELHVALAHCQDNPAFTPEPLSPAYRRHRYELMCRLAEHNLALLERRLHVLPASVEPEARSLLDARPDLMDRFQAFKELEGTALRIRCHGDYHLGQVLWTGQDFVIVDFEGEPARPLSERRVKHPGLLDVAGMLRSFHYAAYVAFPSEAREDHRESWLRYWVGLVGTEFLKGYAGIAGTEPFFPESENEVHVLLSAYMLEKAVYELGYELNNRPDWITIPLRGISQLLKQQ